MPRRRSRLALIVAAAVLFLAISALLARVFGADGAERDAITALVQAEARGDAAAVLTELSGCRASSECRARAAAVSAPALSGNVAILQLEPSTGFALSSTLGTARVAWRAGAWRPVTQCVRVRRSGNALTGITVELLAVSRRLKADAGCSGRF